MDRVCRVPIVCHSLVVLAVCTTSLEAQRQGKSVRNKNAGAATGNKTHASRITTANFLEWLNDPQQLDLLRERGRKEVAALKLQIRQVRRARPGQRFTYRDADGYRRDEILSSVELKTERIIDLQQRLQQLEEKIAEDRFFPEPLLRSDMLAKGNIGYLANSSGRLKTFDVFQAVDDSTLLCRWPELESLVRVSGVSVEHFVRDDQLDLSELAFRVVDRFRLTPSSTIPNLERYNVIEWQKKALQLRADN